MEISALSPVGYFYLQWRHCKTRTSLLTKWNVIGIFFTLLERLSKKAFQVKNWYISKCLSEAKSEVILINVNINEPFKTGLKTQIKRSCDKTILNQQERIPMIYKDICFSSIYWLVCDRKLLKKQLIFCCIKEKFGIFSILIKS